MDFFKPFSLADSPLFLKLGVISAAVFLHQTPFSSFTIYYFSDDELPAMPELEHLLARFSGRLHIVCKTSSKLKFPQSLGKWSPAVFERYHILQEIGLGAWYIDTDILLWRPIPESVLEALKQRVLTESWECFALLDRDNAAAHWYPTELPLGYQHFFSKENYFNSGILIKGSLDLNADRIYRMGVTYQNEYGTLPFGDQDAFNIVNLLHNVVGKLTQDDLVVWTPYKVNMVLGMTYDQMAVRSVWQREAIMGLAEDPLKMNPDDRELFFHYYGKKDEMWVEDFLRLAQEIIDSTT